MPTLRRRVVATSLAALLATGLATLPAGAAPGPVQIDLHDSYVPTRAYDVTSSANGTLFGADVGGDHGRNYLKIGTMTTGTGSVDLGPGQWATVDPQIRANRVAIPQEATTWDGPVVEVKTCLVGTCPVMTRFDVPPGTVYVGNGLDKAILWRAADSSIVLADWDETVTHAYPLPGVTDVPTFAEGDATGLVVSAGGDAYYVSRSAGTVTNLGYANDVVLTPTYAVWWAMGIGETAPFRTKVWRVARTSPAAAPAETTLPGDPGIDRLVATNAGFAYLVPNGDEHGTETLWSAAWDSAPAAYARPMTTNALAPFMGGSSFLVNDRLAGIPGFYDVAPGAVSGSLVGLVPVSPAYTMALAASAGRAAYIDDMTADSPLFVRSVLGGSPGPETMATDWTQGTSVGLSGPYVVFTREGTTPTTTQVVFGPVGGPYQTRILPVSEVGTVGISGRTVYVTHGARARLVDAVTNAVTDLGKVYVGVFGRYAVTISYETGEIRRRDLVLGTSQVIRPAIAGCPAVCIDEERVQIAVWGNEVVYAFEAAAGPAVVAEHWNGNTGMTGSLSPLTSGAEPFWYELKYWAGLLLVSHVGGEIKLYDMRTGAPSFGEVLASNSERPLALDGHVAGWRPNSDLRAVVQDVTEKIGGYVASPRYLGSVAPAGFGPGLGTGTWEPTMLVSQDVTYDLEVRAGGFTGPIVHVAEGRSVNGEIRVKPWDGTDMNTGLLAAQGMYTWVLKGDSVAGAGSQPLLPENGSAAPITGAVYLSRTPLAAPAVNAPVRTSDVSAAATFPISWTPAAGTPAGTRYTVERSANGGRYAPIATLSATSLTVSSSPGTTYRFRVRGIDPAGRAGSLSGVGTTMAPHDDPTGTIAGSWTTVRSASYYRGTARRASAAGATFSFSATGTQIHLVGVRGPSYGQFQVSIDGGAYSAPIDSYAAATSARQVLYTKTGLPLRAHTIKVRVVGTARRPYVAIDGVAFLR